MIGKLPLAILLLSVYTIPQKASATEGKEIGSLSECAHQLSGKVFVKNEREIIIKGFNYDGRGPGAWFHGQLKGSKAVATSDNNYKTLPYPDGSCDRLTVGRSYRNEDITLILPVSIKEFETIGVLCYQFCHNFGHIVIPKDLDVPPAPEDLLKVNECAKPPYRACSSTGSGAIKPDCANAPPQPMSDTSGANINERTCAPILGIIAVLGFSLGRPNFR